jgi:hypothetical protein
MYNKIDEIGQTFNHMRNRNRHRPPSIGIRRTGRDPFTHPRETGSNHSPCTKQEQGQDQQAKKTEQRAPSTRVPGTGLDLPPNTPSSDNLLAHPPRNRAKISVQKPRIDYFSSRGAGTSSDQQRVTSQCGKDPSDVTLFETFSKRSRPSTTDDTANTKVHRAQNENRNEYVYTYVCIDTAGGRWGW